MRDLNSLNRVILLGRLGRKPELRVLPQTGRGVANFTMATNERFTDKNTRENKDRTEWHRIVVWGPLANFARSTSTRAARSSSRASSGPGAGRTGTAQEVHDRDRGAVRHPRRQPRGRGARRRPGRVYPDAEAPSEFPGENDTSGEAGGDVDDDAPPF